MYNKHNHLKQKIINTDQYARLRQLIRYWRFKDKSIVFTNGCFDLFHPGHADFLARASDLANVLVVGLNTDASVQRLKGSGRPIQDQQGRATILASLHFVDAVVFFDEDTPEEIIELIAPDILVKGGDYRPEHIVGGNFVRSNNGQVLTLPLLKGYSTTNLINKIKTID